MQNVYDNGLQIAQNLILALIDNDKIEVDQIPEQFKKFYNMVESCIDTRFNRQFYNEIKKQNYRQTNNQFKNNYHK